MRIVSCCGFDSIPHDLGALFTVKHLPGGAPITVEGFVRAKGTFSGGTWQSAIGAMAKMRDRPKRSRREASAGRKVRGIKPRIRYEASLRSWVCPMPTIDPQIVLRSARSLDAYGPDFRYGHYVQVRSAISLAGLVVGVGTVVALAQIPRPAICCARSAAPVRAPRPRSAPKAPSRSPFTGPPARRGW